MSVSLMVIHHDAWERVSTARVEPAVYGQFRPGRILIADPKVWALDAAKIGGDAVAFHAGEIEMRSWDERKRAYEIRTRHCIDLDALGPTMEIGRPIVLTIRVLAAMDKRPVACVGSLIVTKIHTGEILPRGW